MKRIFIILGLIFTACIAFSQTVDYNKIILPENANNIEFEEKLVQLAWRNHPSNQVLYNNLSAAQYETKIASAEWLNVIRLSGNINEFNINSDPNNPNDRSQFYPRYNIGAIIPLGIFVSTPNQVKRGREMEQVALHNINNQKLAMRAQVLRLYNAYLMNKEIFNIRSQELEEASANFLLLQQKFEKGEEQYDKYVQGLSTFNRTKIDRAEAQADYLNSKLSLEEMIGLKLEDVK